jgi:hypothetical protein
LYFGGREVMEISCQPCELFFGCFLFDRLLQEDFPFLNFFELRVKQIIFLFEFLEVELALREVMEVLPVIVTSIIFLDDSGLVVEISDIPLFINFGFISFDQ